MRDTSARASAQKDRVERIGEIISDVRVGTIISMEEIVGRIELRYTSWIPTEMEISTVIRTYFGCHAGTNQFRIMTPYDDVFRKTYRRGK